MHSVLIAVLFGVSMFVCGFAGMAVNRRAPERHFTDNARDLIKLVVALTSTLSALVLSLLVASSYGLYTSQKTGLETLAARAIEINRTLVHYGPDAGPGRDILKAALDEGLAHFWGSEKPTREMLTLPKAAGNAPIRSFSDYLETLTPDTDPKKRMVGKMSAVYSSLMESRDMMFMQLSSPIAWQLLMVLACWTSALFFGFGLVTRMCVTAVATLAVGATIMGGAIFLILDLSQPYSGVIRLSPAPLLQAIAFVNSR